MGTRLGMSTEREIHVTCNPLGGSVQHYHHFPLGYLVPLVSEWNSLVSNSGATRILVRSCAILDPILHALELPRLVVLPQQAHSEMKLGHQIGTEEIEKIRFVTLTGYDYPQSYRSQIFNSVKNQLLFRFCNQIMQHQEKINIEFTQDSPKILFINRLNPDSFY